eukprot:CAMPEP_0178772306 /NCGR_PEP_ID=MMETSP0744-20121128/22477_1 /TAXON_ID=913974 /ORGANISM="Nitzschia punctata, Strain CCMP561" /LENGTH=370 /DNA_ID=CAMNT_0020428985 /DNA_START=9 /DNA_END=1120 /DNA_ORIENTATION=+
MSMSHNSNNGTHSLTDSSAQEVDSGSTEVSDGTGRESFPYKLHTILDDASGAGFDDIISWTPDGNSFKVFSKARFEEVVMGRYFESNKYKTFQRNLNLWGFQVGPNKEIKNEFFVRGQPELCGQMQRIKNRGAYIRGAGTQQRARKVLREDTTKPSGLSKSPGSQYDSIYVTRNEFPATHVMQQHLQRLLNDGISATSTTSTSPAMTFPGSCNSASLLQDRASLLSLLVDEEARSSATAGAIHRLIGRQEISQLQRTDEVSTAVLSLLAELRSPQRLSTARVVSDHSRSLLLQALLASGSAGGAPLPLPTTASTSATLFSSLLREHQEQSALLGVIRSSLPLTASSILQQQQVSSAPTATADLIRMLLHG